MNSFTMQGSDKHFLESPATLVVDSLTGLSSTNPNVALDVSNKGKFTVAVYYVSSH